MSNYYILVKNEKGVWPLCLEPNTKKRCKQKLDWQQRGGFNMNDYTIIEEQYLDNYKSKLTRGCYRVSVFEQWKKERGLA